MNKFLLTFSIMMLPLGAAAQIAIPSSPKTPTGITQPKIDKVKIDKLSETQDKIESAGSFVVDGQKMDSKTVCDKTTGNCAVGVTGPDGKKISADVNVNNVKIDGAK